MTNVRLRYTGELSVTFQHPGVGYVEPGDEFDVPEDEAEAFTRRADIELVSGNSGRGRSRNKNSGDGDTGSGGDTGAETGTDATSAGDPDPDA